MSDAIEVFEDMKKRFPRGFEGTDFRFGLTDNGDLMNALGGFNFNPKSFRDYETALRDVAEQMGEGFLTRGDGTIQTVMRHEFGHNLDSQLRKDFYYPDRKETGEDLETWKKNDERFHKALQKRE